MLVILVSLICCVAVAVVVVVVVVVKQRPRAGRVLARRVEPVDFETVATALVRIAVTLAPVHSALIRHEAPQRIEGAGREARERERLLGESFADGVVEDGGALLPLARLERVAEGKGGVRIGVEFVVVVVIVESGREGRRVGEGEVDERCGGLCGVSDLCRRRRASAGPYEVAEVGEGLWGDVESALETSERGKEARAHAREGAPQSLRHGARALGGS